MAGKDSTIPSINVTDVANSTPALHVDPGAPNSSLLAPASHPPPSPVSSDYSSTSTFPPSPTMSVHSNPQFKTSLALRENQPDDRSGLSSLHMLSPKAAEANTHKRKPSNATINSSITEADVELEDVSKVKSYATSLTDVDSYVPSTPKSPEPSQPNNRENKDKKEKKKKGRKGSNDDDGMTTHQRELLLDEGIDPAPFMFKPYKLAHMLDPKDIETLVKFGGTTGILRGLGTNPEHGLSTKSLPRTGTSKSVASAKSKNDLPTITLTEPSGLVREPSSSEDHPAFSGTFDDRRRVYGENVLPHRPSKSLLELMWLAMKDKVLILLSIAAIISLALGLFQDFGTPREPGQPPVEWVEGVAIMIAIAIVVLVGSLNDWQKERQFQKLNEKKEERGVKVIRDGQEKEVVVGDIALLEPGEIVPCDGVFLSGHNIKCDESGATGESDAIKKVTYDEMMELLKDGEPAHTDCFVVSGSKVLEGVGKYVIVAIGEKSYNGRIMTALRTETEDTPLQIKLNHLAELIAKIGSAAGLILFIALLIRFFVQLGTGEPVRTASQKGIAFVNILIISVTLIVVAVPEGLPLAVTLALAFATKRMTYENLLVRVLGSCETMANASVVCTDKTGTLTQNAMTVVAGSIGIHAKFVRELDGNAGRSNAGDKGEARKHPEDFSIDQTKLNDVLSPQLRELLNEAIAVNSTAFEDVDPESGEPIFVGSKTETALLQFAKELGWRNFRETREGVEIIQMVPFSSARKSMGVVIRLPNGGHRLYVKGASEILSKKCNQHVVVHSDGKFPASDAVETRPIDELAQDNISRTIIFYANQTLRTIALCYRDFPTWPPQGTTVDEQNEVPYDELAQDLTLIGITGIEDPLRPGVRESVVKCHRAGVTIKMCTGDNVLTARSIANQCGIFTPGGIIMEGPVFRQLTQAERIEIVPRLQVLARSSPEDKKVLVETLKSIGEIVGVTGDGTNDGPALKTANVGFSMGIAGTEVAKEASDIILMDDNFSSIVKAIIWGRCVNDAVRKFLQFQISTNVTAVVITFVTAVASDQEESVLTAVQLLWINIIMDTFAALALATDPATEKLLERKPDKKTAPLFTTEMYKMILFQSIYQIVIILVFHFRGHQILGYDFTNRSNLIVKTLVFNTFVFAQIFNSVNCRRLDRGLNIFEGILKNPYFIGITLLEIAVQVIIVFVGGAAFQVTPIPGREWGISLALGFVSIPWGVFVRLLPSAPFEKAFRVLGFFGREEEELPTSRPDKETWTGAINLVRDNLGYFSNVRGGRLRASSFVGKSRNARLSSDGDKLPVPSMMAMVPTLVAGTIATGTRIKRDGSLSDPAHADPSKSSAALWDGKLQIHPDTPKDDPAWVRFSGGGHNAV
ncbi:calcium-transporting ATPase [Macrolepiota fuliginosa MF-IS2]|uniref:Calcium-transporting ATPase n=1 Tax=Macrolepiota fuliginosa MF-IS2 TaxID=1400762 RepID=A0A9P5XCR4_9AGAR|nr:calcium-transporting ATPase [Macrolepiota fuliginosa MF-IS2]